MFLLFFVVVVVLGAVGLLVCLFVLFTCCVKQKFKTTVKHNHCDIDTDIDMSPETISDKTCVGHEVAFT